MVEGNEPGVTSDQPPEGSARGGFDRDKMMRSTAPAELESPENRQRWELGADPEDRGPYLVELNVLYVDGLATASLDFIALFREVVLAPAAGSAATEDAAGAQDDRQDLPSVTEISKSYLRCYMNVLEWKALVAADESRATRRARRSDLPATGRGDFRYRTMYKLWPDFPVEPHIMRSVATIKADAALRTFDATGDGMTWVVIDSGVDAEHPHFGPSDDHTLNDPLVRSLHRCFVEIDGKLLDDPESRVNGRPRSKKARDVLVEEHRALACTDPYGHGTHVAGIIAGRAGAADEVETVILETEQRIEPGEEGQGVPKRTTLTTRRVVSAGRELERLHGIAPGCRVISLRVLDANGRGRSSNIVRALAYIREKLNDNPKLLRVQGVNLSVGYEFDAEMFACGQSPLCSEVDRLVQSGVVVVCAAGNTGYARLESTTRVTKIGLSNTINDPGNAKQAITVGSTHRESPHTFGVSYFSSKGPTGDGRLKPDLVAPGERIVSCAAGRKRSEAVAAAGEKEPADTPGQVASSARSAEYVEDSGTSMAAPHVSGAIAAFLSIRREFIGQPAEVKRIFLESATPLGREQYFEGHGLVDLMRAIQSV